MRDVKKQASELPSFKDVEELLSITGEGSQLMGAGRESADVKARIVMRAVEARLVAALDGDTLHGLPNLIRDGASKMNALRVVAGARHGRREFLERDGKNVLVLGKHGKLLWVSAVEDEISFTGPSDNELFGWMLAPFLKTVQVALEEHLARTAKRLDSYEDTVDLCKRLAEVLGVSFFA